MEQEPQAVPDAVGGEAGVELEEALISEGLQGAVPGAGVWELPVRTRLHLLDAGLDKVEGQTAGSCAEASDDGSSQDDCLAASLKSSTFQHFLCLQATSDSVTDQMIVPRSQ